MWCCVNTDLEITGKIDILADISDTLCSFHAASSASLASRCTKLYDRYVCQNLTGPGVAEISCLKLLETDPEITSAENFFDLSSYVLKMAIRKATEGQNYFMDEMSKHPSSSAIKECAIQDYNWLVGSFRFSLFVFTGDTLFARSILRSAFIRLLTTCNDALIQEKVTNPSLYDLNREMAFLTIVASKTLDAYYSSNDCKFGQGMG
ncbi:hypothetical protein RJT34_24559 [Clitoria ternatea]|uniref:Uncharacterized protein n=1 Tax=Clitoria ternatea TaxID=43366 RepID=A0AAN9IL98_CLITE